jgi:hypothetical protein
MVMWEKVVFAIGIILSMSSDDSSVYRQVYPANYSFESEGDSLMLVFGGKGSPTSDPEHMALMGESCPEFRVEILPYDEIKWSNPLLSWLGYWQAERVEYDKAIATLTSDVSAKIVTVTGVTKLARVASCHYQADMVTANRGGLGGNHLMVTL